MKKYWVGVLKGRWEDHRVFEFQGDPEPSDAPDCDYVIGPFDTKAEAQVRAKAEHNKTGMFADPFGPKPHGR
jgi:hypothetical protein